MNGQPTAQNTRETGAHGDLPGFRNYENPEHVAQLAELWNVDELQIPHFAPTADAMKIFRHCEEGSINQLWISGTNPPVSLPELHRIRSILAREDLLVAAPEVWVEVSRADAERFGLADGELARVATARGEVHARVRVNAIREGVVFLPFHYGYFDAPERAADRDRAANELTRTQWDLASKQPLFKAGAASIAPVA